MQWRVVVSTFWKCWVRSGLLDAEGDLNVDSILDYFALLQDNFLSDNIHTADSSNCF